MGENSGISWCHHTLNWWMGCTKTSAGCKHCYAETLVTTRMRLPVWGDKAERKATSASTRKQVHTWNRKAREAGERHRVFCSSLSDVFEDRPDTVAPRARLFKLIEETRNLDWLPLTKRPENMVRLAEQAGWPSVWPGNVWAGCTVENNDLCEKRMAALGRVPARIRFLSCEPLLSKVHLTCIPANIRPLTGDGYQDYYNALTGNGHDPQADEDDDSSTYPRVHWVIVGSESGHGARPMGLDWARDLVDQCQRYNVPVFVKQIANAVDKKGENPEHWPAGNWPRQFPA